MISPHPPRLRMNRRNTVSVTPAIGASTVAGEMATLPIVSEAGTTRASEAENVARALLPASAASAPAPEVSQNFFTVLFYLPRKTACTKPAVHNKAPAKARAEFLRFIRVIRGEKKLLRRSRGSLFLRVLAAEALHTPSGVHQLLLAGKERMAGRADFNTDVALMSRPRDKCVAARAMHAHFVVCRMNGCFHSSPNLDSDL